MLIYRIFTINFWGGIAPLNIHRIFAMNLTITFYGSTQI